MHGRGGERKGAGTHGGFAQACARLSDQVVERAGTIHIKADWAESLRKNRRRRNPDRPDSILEHSLEDKKMGVNS